MQKRLLIIGMLTMALLILPYKTMAENIVNVVETSDFYDISISYSQNSLRIVNAGGETLQVFNIAGICVLNAKIETADKRFELNFPKGCYIVKVGKIVRKVSVK